MADSCRNMAAPGDQRMGRRMGWQAQEQGVPSRPSVLRSFCVMAALLPTLARGAESEALSELSLQELGNLEVTSVSKSPELLREAPAAIYVITQDRHPALWRHQPRGSTAAGAEPAHHAAGIAISSSRHAASAAIRMCRTSPTSCCCSSMAAASIHRCSPASIWIRRMCC